MRLSEVRYDAPKHLAMNENKLATRGYLLRTLGVDLEHLPDTLFQRCQYVPAMANRSVFVYDRVHIKDIIGTSYAEYAGDSWLAMFLKVKRLDYYIQHGCITRGKYLRMLKMGVFDQPAMVQLSKTKNGYYVDGNGNHRIAAYKMMYLVDCATSDLV